MAAAAAAGSHLDVPDGARGVDAGGAQPFEILFVPIEGRQGRTELALLILRWHPPRSVEIKATAFATGAYVVEQLLELDSVLRDSPHPQVVPGRCQ
jgi:hypothetical protein